MSNDSNGDGLLIDLDDFDSTALSGEMVSGGVKLPFDQNNVLTPHASYHSLEQRGGGWNTGWNYNGGGGGWKNGEWRTGWTYHPDL